MRVDQGLEFPDGNSELSGTEDIIFGIEAMRREFQRIAKEQRSGEIGPTQSEKNKENRYQVGDIVL